MSGKNSSNISHKESRIPQGNKYKKNVVQEESNNIYVLLPILLIIGFLPLVMKLKVYDPKLSQYSWFADDTSISDIFLYYKHWLFVIITAILLVVIVLYSIYKRRQMRASYIFIPLGVYVFFALLSSFLSVNKEYSFTGGYEHFESVLALLGYVIVTFYSYQFLKSEQDLSKVLNCLIAVAIIMGVLGLMQYLGHDLFATELGYNLIMPTRYRSNSELKFAFEENRVYLTLYNPNYVGVFTALVLPIILVMLLFSKSVKVIIPSILAVLGLFICAIGSTSLAAMIGLIVAGIFILIFMWRYLVKKPIITISVTLVIAAGLVLLSYQTDHFLYRKFMDALSINKTEYALTQMDTNEDNISLTYNGNKLFVECILNDDSPRTIYAKDEAGIIVNNTYDEINQIWTITDERFPGFLLGMYQNSELFYIQAEGYQYLFIYDEEAGSYYHLNRMGKLDQMKTAEAAVFTGYEALASGRGYIWSRTIPILDKYLLVGSGPDTFVQSFPQQDYINYARYGYGNSIITKPHNMYLQIWAQTGLISLLAFLAFYGIYFIWSIKLYIRSRYDNYYSKMGVAIFIGTVAYMVTGLTNDSSITVAPVFWTLLGIGLAVNYKVKALKKDNKQEA